MRRELFTAGIGVVAALVFAVPVLPVAAQEPAHALSSIMQSDESHAQAINDTSADGVDEIDKTHTPQTNEQSFSSIDSGSAPYSLEKGGNDGTSDASGSRTIVASADLSGLATVGVTWNQQDMTNSSNAPTYRLRYFQDNAWSDWVELPSVDEDSETMGISPSYYVGDATKVEAELIPVVDQTITEAKLVTIDSGYSVVGDAQGSAYRDSSAHQNHNNVAQTAVLKSDTKSQVQSTAAVTATGTIHTREEWWVNGNPSMDWPPERDANWKGAIVHHTVDRNNYSQAEVPAMINGIYLYHNVHNSWGDIGYQLLVDRFGGIWEGRDEGVANKIVPASQVVGAQSKGFNYDTFGVALLGSYHLNVAPTDTQINSVAAAIAWEFDALGINDPYGTFEFLGTQLRITGHGDSSHWAGSDLNRTQCPGQQVWDRMGHIRDLVYGYLRDVTHLPVLSVGSGTFYVDSAKQLKSSLQIESDSSDTGVAVILQSGTQDAMKFEFKQQSDGSYEIVSAKSGLALDVKNGSAFRGAVVQQWTRNNSSSQRWWLRIADTGGVYIQSALGNWVLDLASGDTSDGTRVQLDTPNGNQSQQFVVASATTIGVSGPIRITPNGQDALSLGIVDDSYGDGALAQLQNWSGNDAQLFRFNRVGNGIYEIQSVNSAKMLEAQSGGVANGTGVRQWSSNGALAQRWTLRDADNGSIGLINAKSGLSLGTMNKQLQAGATVQLYDWNGDASQIWSVSAAESQRGGLSRLAGSDRYETSDAVMNEGFKKSDWVVIASGEGYADALSASALAGALNAPVLLSRPDTVSESLASRIRALNASKAVLIGSNTSLSSHVESAVSQLVSKHEVYRFGGATRYETSLSILRDAPEKLGFSWADTAIIASGEGPYDALSVSPIAWKRKAPIVLTGKNGLSADILQTVKKYGFNKVLLIGSETVVPTVVEQQLGALPLKRLGGADRYETSAEVIDYALRNKLLKADGAILASGENYPDALSGSSFAGSTGNVLALVNGADARTVKLVAENQSSGNKDTAYVLGSTKVFGQYTAERIASAMNKHMQ